MHHVSGRARERERHRARNKYAWHQVGVYCVRIRKRKQLERARAILLTPKVRRGKDERWQQRRRRVSHVRFKAALGVTQ